MSERAELLIALTKEVLGPRYGPYETLPPGQDPRSEYITGVLAPLNAPHEHEIEAEAENISEEVVAEEDGDGSDAPVVSSTVAPALDPRALPSSIGLTFTLGTASNQEPQIDVCATWGRYALADGCWTRTPHGFVTGPIRVDTEDAKRRCWQAGSGVRLEMRARRLDGESPGWRVSLFLVNTTSVTGDRPDTKHFVFQPQIRVRCSPGTVLMPVRAAEQVYRSSSGSDILPDEGASLDLLYRNKTALARGHLCGAVWKAIDPERPHPTIPGQDAAPFAWTDSVAVSDLDRPKFSPADVRTELVPCYAVEAPSMGWDEAFGPSPELDPEELAELWEPSQLRERLEPLVEGYRTWIQCQRNLIQSLPQHQQEIALAHLGQCESTAERMQEAIDILVADQDVRLAFCFANKAISLQAQWSRSQRLIWRPFQLAFILLNVPALADPHHPSRLTCDLLWIPTGGGKTEAYLGLVAFTLALRRRRWKNTERSGGGGVGIISRYTLRLLTIQQFRRALGLITACEYLRVHGLDSPTEPVGWRPRECPITETFLWGGVRFSAGLWVGGGVTPNNLHSSTAQGENGLTFYAGALDILRGARPGYDGPNKDLRKRIGFATRVEGTTGEPAQVLSCPCCKTPLAVPDEGFGAGNVTLHFVFSTKVVIKRPPPEALQPESGSFQVSASRLTSHGADTYTLSADLVISEGNRLTADDVDRWWTVTVAPRLGNATLRAARPARPGYFIIEAVNVQRNTVSCDFEIYCPNPKCLLNHHAWAEQVPLNRDMQIVPADELAGNGFQATDSTAELPLVRGLHWQDVPDWTRKGHAPISSRIPIPACTVDDQIYHRCPSLVIGTVDKFARLAFEPRASALFGNVDHYHSRWGYYREGCPPPTSGNLPESYQPHPPGRARGQPLHIAVPPFRPPDLILQDELHLIEGPLGSVTGLYETAVDLLCRSEYDGKVVGPKYVASTATVRQAASQVAALFNRTLAHFPPPALTIEDRFFTRDRSDDEVHPLDSTHPGRLYVGICAPGRGAQTPIVRIWSALLQSVHEQVQTKGPDKLDGLFTLVGYFNAIRELAGAVSLLRQDIPERMEYQAGTDKARPVDRWMELSSRTRSLDLPGMLENLSQPAPQAPDVVFTTSMFGTGVDVDRLDLMVVNGQPKTTASYIQATGRVGRRRGALVVTFFRASRPRDLDHYEFFTGYHRQLYRHVEPVAVAPFSPRARERALGPLAVILLRHARELGGQEVSLHWRVQQRLSGAYHSEACRMACERHAPEVQAIPKLLEQRALTQPAGRRPPSGVTAQEVELELDRWKALAALHRDTNQFVYHEPGFARQVSRHVVLGDAQHRAWGLDQVFENAPQSMRDVEETTGFQT